MTLPELLQLSGSYWSTCTLHAGVKLDVFTPLADRPLTASQLARLIAADERGLAMLLNALTAMDLLSKEAETFRATPFSSEYLAKTSDTYMGHIIMHHHHLVEGWSRLDEAVKSGVPVRRRSSEAGDDERESFLMGMFNLASHLAPRIASSIDLGGRRRLLDLAGGPGTYAINFCKQNPDLTAVIYDLPTTRPFAEQTVGRFGLSGRISFSAGDITSDDIGTGYDVVWISHLLHSEGPDACAAIVAKAATALKAGGLLLIQEFILDDNRIAPLHPTLFSLNMLVGTPSGQAYSQGELRGMMEAAGLRAIRRLEMGLPNGAGIMAGTR
ncbi:acetylserotonin O-methyltransferase [Geobacter sp. AOG2]|uniref:acetylserotonin O-methyltransferase n=1 Tax=Geobacter sp. AOG2 TaxID=1566347 RepID=UPI001CC6F8C9|nr:acetylserotonin O-methyltransferase [Geobacter sp. AOG2]GFE60981.1 SAM-dependent methyltransferase [Geobacter sp. AOG2]